MLRAGANDTHTLPGGQSPLDLAKAALADGQWPIGSFLVLGRRRAGSRKTQKLAERAGARARR